jgi:hypothetical protein
MNDRMQRALDGELSRDELTPAEAAELDESNALFAGILRSISPPPLPSLGAAVLRRIDAVEESAISPWAGSATTQRSSGLMSWLWSPTRFSISLRPAYAIGVAAVLAVIVGVQFGNRGVGNLDHIAERPGVATSTGSQEVLVQFRFEAPRARAVSLAGDFSDWSPTYALKRSEPGVWTVVVPLKPGVHDYSFIVDGEKWTPDPAAPAMADGFGGMNSRIAVLASDTKRSL